MEAIQHAGLSAALFAPGWVFENFDGDNFRLRDRKFWISSDAFEPESSNQPVAKYAPLLESGSRSFFYTNFNRGFGKGWWSQSMVRYLDPDSTILNPNSFIE